MYLIVANWKMNPSTLKGAKHLFNSVKRRVRNIKNVEIVICPPFPYLSIINNHLSVIKFGAQDCFWQEKGPFTGEVSPKMLKDLGVEYVIVGHSERRALGETDEVINKKIKAVMAVKLKAIFCFGETVKERKLGMTFKVIKSQIEKGLRGVSKNNFKNLILAYEPVWAIGSGNPCQPDQAKKALLFLRKFKRGTPILYGGSVNSKNGASYIEESDFDGLLIGGASLEAKEFVKLIKNVSKVC